MLSQIFLKSSNIKPENIDELEFTQSKPNSAFISTFLYFISDSFEIFINIFKINEINLALYKIGKFSNIGKFSK